MIKKHGLSFLTLLLVLGLRSMSLAQSGQEQALCSSSDKNAALVIIDMQNHFLGRVDSEVGGNSFKVKELIKEQRLAIQTAKAKGIPILLIEYECWDCDNTISELKSDVFGYSKYSIVKKTTDGLFDLNNKYLGEIQAFIKEFKVGSFIFTGVNGGICVKKSIEGALFNECKVFAYTSAIADLNDNTVVYPYERRYYNFNPGCKNCSFTELSTMPDLRDAM